MWIEMDHPATQSVKKSALVRYGNLQPNLQFVSCDLSYDPKLTALIGEPFYDCRKKTLYIAEGLLAYLDRQTASNIMRTLQKCGAVGSRLLGTMNASNGSPNPLVNLKLKLIGEPYRWGLAPELLPGYLRGLAWEASEIKKGQALADQYLREKTILRIPEDEYLFSAIKHLGMI
jgi:O-methyltransferase involved in polyketide biosynthesis